MKSLPDVVWLSFFPEQRSRIRQNKRRKVQDNQRELQQTPSNDVCHLDSIEDKILKRILSFLNTTEVMYVAKYVCKRWYILCKSPIQIDAHAWCQGSLSMQAAQRFLRNFNPTYVDHFKFSHATLGEAEALNSVVGDARPLSVDFNCTQGLLDDHIDVISRISSKVRYLTLAFCGKVTPAAMRQMLLKSVEIQTVVLNDSQVDGSVTNALSKSKQLKSVNLSNCQDIDDKDVQELLQSSTIALTHLNLSLCKISDLCLTCLGNPDNIGTRLSLATLELQGCRALTDVGVRSIAHCSHLRGLDLSWCHNITDASVAEIAKNCTELQTLTLLGCVKISNPGLEAIASNNACLRSLKISDCVLISDEGLMCVANKCKQLQEIHMSRCVLATEAAISGIIDGCSRLSCFEVYGCHNLSLTFLKTKSKLVKNFGFDGNFTHVSP